MPERARPVSPLEVAMLTGIDFYRQQIAFCEEAASEEGLPNVRERYLRSQAVWQALIDRALLTEDGRIERREAEARRRAGAERARPIGRPPRGAR